MDTTRFEFTSVLYRPIATDAGLKPCATNEEDATDDPDVRHRRDVAQGFSSATVRLMRPGEEELFGETAAAGWREFGVGDLLREIARVNAAVPSLRLFFAELDGKPIATAALNISGGVAHLAGASTIPEGRKRGAQRALLDHRLRYAAAQGCDVALMGALPGSGSQRNAERHGFRIAYTRVKWRR